MHQLIDIFDLNWKIEEYSELKIWWSNNVGVNLKVKVSNIRQKVKVVWEHPSKGKVTAKFPV